MDVAKRGVQVSIRVNEDDIQEGLTVSAPPRYHVSQLRELIRGKWHGQRRTAINASSRPLNDSLPFMRVRLTVEVTPGEGRTG